MEFKITGKALLNEIRNYIALGFEILACVLNLPSVLCETLAEWFKVD
jgi:hypothetical protein